MTLEGEDEPSPWDWVSKQVAEFEASGGKEGNELQGKPIVVLTTRGRKSGKLRKSALMRVEHDGEYAVVASMGGAPTHPVWYLSLVAEPRVKLQDGDKVLELRARTAAPEEKRTWWPHCVEAWPPYEEYQSRTTRDIPVVLFDSL